MSAVPISSACANDTILLYDSTWSSFESAHWDHCPGDLNRIPAVTNFGNIQNSLTYPRNISIVKDGNIWYGFINNISASTIYRLNFGGSLSNNPVLDTLIFTPNGANPGNSSCKLSFNKSGGNWYGIQVTDANRMLIHHFGNSLGNNNISTSVYANPFSLLSNSRDLALVKQNDSLFAFVININSNNISHFAFGPDLSSGPISGSNFTVLSDSSLMTGSGSIDAVKTCGNWYVFVGSQGTDNIARVKLSGNFNQILDAELIASSNQIVNPQTIEVVADSGQWKIFAKTNAGTGLLKIDLGDDIEGTPSVTALGPYGNTINGSLALSMDMVRDGTKWHCFVANAQNGSERIIRLSYPEPCETQTFSSGYPGQMIANSGGEFSITFSGRLANGNWMLGLDELTVKNAPDVSFEIEGQCFGDSTRFTDSTQSEEAISDWSWNFDNGQLSSLQHPTVLYTDTGNYEVSLTATSTTGCSSTASQIMRIHPLPVALFSADTVCQFNEVAIQDSSWVALDSIVQRRWVVQGDTQFLSIPEIVMTDTGVHDIQLQVISGAGCRDSATLATYVKASPDLSFSVDATCTQDTTNFLNTSTIAAGSVSYSWFFGDGNTSNAVSPAHVYATAGTYDLMLVGAANNGCADTLQSPMVISIKPEAAIALPSPPHCTGVALSLADTGDAFNQPVIARYWAFGDGNTSTVNAPAHVFTDTGTFEIYLVSYTGTQCFAKDSVEISVLYSPSPSFDYHANCKGNLMQLQDSSTILGFDSIINTSWILQGDTHIGKAAIHELDLSDDVVVSLLVTASNGCASSLDSNITIIEAPSTEILAPDPLSCTALNKVFNAINQTDTSDSILDIRWTTSVMNNPIDSGTGTTYILNTTTASTHQVWVEVTTSAGCTSRDSASVAFVQSPELSIEVPAKNCFGIPSDFSSNYAGTNYEVTWGFGDGLSGANSQVQHQYFESGVFNVFCEILDKATGCTDSASMQHRVLEELKVDFEVGQTCSSTPTIFEEIINLQHDTISTLIWDVSEVGTLIGSRPVVTIGDTNAHVVTLKATTSNGCFAMASGLVKPELGPSMDPIWQINTLEAPYEVSFDARAQLANAVQWVIDGDTLDGESHMVLFPEEKEITALVTARKDSNCVLTQSMEVQIMRPLIDLAILDTRIEATDSGQVCFAEIANNGNALIRSFEVMYTLDKLAMISNSYQRHLLPGSSVWVKSRSALGLQNRSLDLYCAKVTHGQFHLEVDTINNEMCKSLDAAHHVPPPHPNPFNESVNVELHLTSFVEEFDLEVYNLSGQLILSRSYTRLNEGVHLLEVELSGLSKGFYVLSLNANDFSARFILTKI